MLAVGVIEVFLNAEAVGRSVHILLHTPDHPFQLSNHRLFRYLLLAANQLSYLLCFFRVSAGLNLMDLF